MRPGLLTAVIVAKNEEENIKECLESIPEWCKCIVVDNGSIDNTAKIAEELGAVVSLYPEENDFSKLKGFALSLIDTEWGLLIDADERLSEELKIEIGSLLSAEDDLCSGYKIPRKNFYFGKFLRYGGKYPDYQLRLFKTNDAVMDGKPVHEKIIVKGEVKTLNNPLIHYTYNDIDDYLDKQKTYIPLMIRELNEKDTGKDFISRVWWLYFRPFFRFVRRYLFKLGFLDGYEGYLSHYLDSFIQKISYFQYLKEE
jgi:glycosyltransferase involved in cell wall biosynthesis